MICKLCDFDECRFYCQINKRKFVLCPMCQLIFVPEDNWVSVDAEKKRYQNHNNTVDNIGYVKFLEEVVHVVSDSVGTSSRILDFGSGQSAVLTNLLNKQGFHCTPYDPNFDLKIDEVGPFYDSIILCETIEHLRNVKSEIVFIKSLLNNAGNIVIRTKLYPEDKEAFTTWWYNKDITHINFFSIITLSSVAEKMGLTLHLTEYPDVFLLNVKTS